jgi:hypothetical protein
VNKTGTLSLFFSAAVASICALVAPEVSAKEMTCATLEILPPPAVLGTNAATLRSVAEPEVRRVDATLSRGRHRVVISLALTREARGTQPIVGVNATVRDARTGAMLAIIETNARADGNGPVSSDQERQLAYSAVRNAVRRVPGALHGK